ncbi:MAG: hypothetical protein A2145_07230 [candidate division Zixibacteria bacterium RBG_16_40_9]|nr:MAG: hypothetical protein A2145_07230 [candidate division Zixibacteria bacterium RBG_16_40_9]
MENRYKLTDAPSIARVEEILSQIGGQRILVLGDIMLDEYWWGNVSRISPEAPVPVVEVLSEEVKLGGAANVALNLKILGDEPILVGIVGDDDNANRLTRVLKKNHILNIGLQVEPKRKTTVKTRIIAHSQQVVRTDRETSSEISDKSVLKLVNFIRKNIKQIQGIIISDYGKGVITLKLLGEVIKLARQNKVFIAVDPKETHFMNYKGVSLITPNHHEAGFVSGKKIKDDKTLEEVGWWILKKLQTDSVLITRGEKGMSLFERGSSHRKNSMAHFPTVARKVYDVTGAGDTVISTLVSCFTAGATLKEAAGISNHAAGIVVGELGTAQVTKKQIWEDFNSYHA